MDLRQLAVRMLQIGGYVGENSSRLVRKVALSIDSTVVHGTPVDTGRARANWFAELGAPHKGTTEQVSPSGAEAIAAAAVVIDQYKSGQTIHLTNNLAYITRLNDGWSAQAPAGFVQTAILNGIGQVPGVKLTEKNGVK
jgi:hypothetical protein